MPTSYQSLGDGRGAEALVARYTGWRRCGAAGSCSRGGARLLMKSEFLERRPKPRLGSRAEKDRILAHPSRRF
jgi:hypothetical protein